MFVTRVCYALPTWRGFIGVCLHFMAVTKKSNLHADTPPWSATPHISLRAHDVPRTSAYDVVTASSDITNALALAGFPYVAVMDRREPVSGSSLASAAMIQHEIDTPPSAPGLLRRISARVPTRHGRRDRSGAFES